MQYISNYANCLYKLYNGYIYIVTFILSFGFPYDKIITNLKVTSYLKGFDHENLKQQKFSDHICRSSLTTPICGYNA